MARAEQRVAAVEEDAGEAAGGAIGLITAACRHVALLAAVLAMGGSLFFSEVLGWLPCQLCWYQRILMYPLTLILTVGILRREADLHLYVLPLSLSGMAVSLYHYLEVMKLIEPSPCVGAVPCSIDYLTPILTGPLGFIKIPFLALVAFTIISIMMGNFALAGDQALPAGPRGDALARRWALALVAAPALIFIGLGLAI